MMRVINYFKRLFSPFYHLDKLIIFILIILASINIMIQYSANDRMFSYLINDIIYLVISFIVLITVANINLNQIKQFSIHFYLVSIILLVAVLIIGIKVHGAKRWLDLGIRIQPSELCKLSVPMLLASYLTLKNDLPKLYNYIISLLIILVPFALIAKQPDLGTAVLVLASGLFVLFFAGLPWKVIIINFLLLIISTPVIWYSLYSYQQKRILTLLNPESDPLGKGYHIIQGIIAIGSGGLFGKGYLQGTQIHLDFIPEKNTDFVITVLAEEFGYLGVCLILTLYLILILRCLKIMQNTPDRFTQILCGSITLSLTLYVLINMGMVTGILPVVGVPLPLISYGGTATIVIMLQLGLILSIKKHNHY